MPAKPKGYNPASKKNLIKMEPLYGERKKRADISVTEDGWERFKILAASLGVRSRSDLIEKIARGQYRLVPIVTLDVGEES